MAEIVSISIMALFVEAVVQALKAIYDKESGGFSKAELLSMAVGVAVAIGCKLNLVAGLISAEGWTVYLLYALTGVAIGRGPSFVHDLWVKLREVK